MAKILKKAHIRSYFIFLLFLIGLLAVACGNKNAGKVSKYAYKVIAEYPHDAQAYTQGLFIHNSVLYESTGQYGYSSLRKVDLQTGEVLQKVSLPNNYFAEGACVLNGKIYQLTWAEHKCLVYDLETFKLLKEFTYSGEGWGLTTDGSKLIMSNGSNGIKFLNPDDFSETRYINVTYEGRALAELNELEYIDGEIWANVYTQDYIVRIDPANGKVTGVVLLHGLLSASLYTATTDVLNGIAYDTAADKLYITGKNWPRLYEITPLLMPEKK